MPIRKVSNRGGNIIGHTPSLKNGRMVAFESTIERDFIQLLEYDPDVLSFHEQPFNIEYIWKNKVHHYTPDFHVVRCSGEQIVECKPLARVDDEENQRKFNVASIWCAENGAAFEIVTDHWIRAGYRLKNVVKLAQFARHIVDDGTRRAILACATHERMALRELAYRVNAVEPNSVLFAIYHLAYHHVLQIDMDTEPISDSTSVSVNGQ